jgi:hypothetical protein
MPAIKPYRDVSEHEVINGLFAYQCAADALPATAGTFVKAGSATWFGSGNAAIAQNLSLWGNSLSPRWAVPAKVVQTTDSGDAAIGMLLYDVRNTDENGEQLIWKRQKAIENNWTISGEGSAIVTRGIFVYSGSEGTPAAGSTAYLADNPVITSAGNDADEAAGLCTKVGKFLSSNDGDGWCLFKLEL